MISIIIPTYNNSKQLIRTIKSISKQNYDNIEIIVIDDSSADDTKIQIEKLKNKKIKYYYNVDNLGTTQSRLKGIKKALGEYIAFLDHDDVWINDKLTVQYECLKKKTLDFVISNYVVKDLINNDQYERSMSAFGNDFQYNIIRNPGPFFQCCLFKKEFLLNNIDSFDSQSEPSEDWDFFISISKVDPRVENINMNLFEWNLNDNSQSSDYYKETCAIEYIINKHRNYINKVGGKKILSLQYRKLASMFLYSKDYKKMKHYYIQAIKNDKLSIKNIILNVICLMPKNIAQSILKIMTNQIK